VKQVLIKAGSVVVSAVPAPGAGPRNILVRVKHSCISVGTEMAGVKMSGLPLYQRALKQPENVKLVLDAVREQGLKRTLDRVSGKLAAGSPTGYSASGEVIAVGSEVEGFAIGDLVACAGAGIANHAEIIDVPVNLSVKLPHGVGTALGSTVTLGAIAMQGVRRAQPTLGETFVVVGLGILGQITAQILTANGCRVIGVDLDPRRIAIARANGIEIGVNGAEEDYVSRVTMATDGFGADGVIVTAAGASDAIISEAMKACRKKGRVVLVGDVGLNLKRADFYKKELDFLISCSYGPGRYDPVYEEGGQDYPFPYVRWTEGRNMQAYLQLIAAGRMRLEGFFPEPYPIDNASAAYEALKAEGEKPLLVLLAYPDSDAAETVRRVNLAPARAASGRIRVGLAGASSFAQGVHIPNLVILRKQFELRAVMTRTGANARAVATNNEAEYCTTDFEELLQDGDLDLIMIANRHDLHGRMVLQALQAGKHVFVEKPLALQAEELEAIEAFYAMNPEGPVLMTGFNRRFSPAVRAVAEEFRGRTGPLIVDYVMNAGHIPLDHWVHGPEGGGRNIGEACHIYDLFLSLCGAADFDTVNALAIRTDSGHWARNDNFVVSLAMADGSVCKLTYTALGDKSYPKERMDVFGEGRVLSLNDYKRVDRFPGKKPLWQAGHANKGHLEELKALAATLTEGAAWPISLADQLQASRIALAVERQIRA
jgi:predicted dehydrogenase/threonine dehydrogenase-like Zn-dependent dehydrogenase